MKYSLSLEKNETETKPQEWTNIHLCQPKYSNDIGVKTDKQKKLDFHILAETFLEYLLLNPFF